MIGSETVIRRRYTFFGSVQGVGFRWRARQAANLYGCTGFCRNERDGSVTMELQGEEEQIGQVIRAIQRGRYISIERMEVQALPPVAERGFITE